jgi:hypothetical protein
MLPRTWLLSFIYRMKHLSIREECIESWIETVADKWYRLLIYGPTPVYSVRRESGSHEYHSALFQTKQKRYRSATCVLPLCLQIGPSYYVRGLLQVPTTAPPTERSQAFAFFPCVPALMIASETVLISTFSLFHYRARAVQG